MGQRGSGSTTCLRWRQGLSLFHVGSVIALRAIDDGVFARCGDHLKLFAQVTADGATVCSDRAVLQAEAVKDFSVGLGHDLVAGFGGHHVAVKAVGVFHGELAPTHQTKTGTAFVAELGLDLVEVFRQLLVAADLLAGDVGDDFFARWLHHKVAAMAVFDTQQLGAHFVEASGLLPQLRGLHDGHGELDRAGFVHLFAHDGFDLANHPQTHRHVVVNASAEFFDEASAHHELVAHDFCVSRGFFEGGDEELGGFHARDIRVNPEVNTA